ncbi:MAG: anti-sigma factor antagonist [Chloroflexi bacterium]|nr:MAG: anti-sigma factor antagonist [Chloroflexota bacterium]
MDIHSEENGKVTVIELFGELDSITAPQAQDHILSLVKQDSRILLDMSQVSYMSSAGLRILLVLYREIQNKVGKIVVCGLNDEVRDVMAITGFLDFFHTVDNREDGLKQLMAS